MSSFFDYDFDEKNIQQQDNTSEGLNSARRIPTTSNVQGVSSFSHPIGQNSRKDSFLETTPPTPTTIPENSTFIQLKKFVELTSGNQQHLLDNENSKVISPLIINKIQQRKVSEILKELEQLAYEAQDPKKANTSKITKIFDDLSIYFATENMVDEKLPYHASVSLALDGDRLSSNMSSLLSYLLNLLKVDDKRVVAYVHYLLSEIHLPRELRDRVLNSLKNEFLRNGGENGSFLIKAFCLRTFDRILRSSFISRKEATPFVKDLIQMVQTTCKELGKENAFATKKGFISKLFKDTDKEEKLYLLRTSLQIVKNYVIDNNMVQGLLENIIISARNKNSECVRDALTVLAGLSLNNNGPTLFAYSSSIPQFESATVDKSKKGSSLVKGITYSKLKEVKLDKKSELLPTSNVEDNFSRFYLTRICATLIKPMRSSNDEEVEETEEAPYEQKYLDTLKHLLHDEDLMVFFEGIKQISLRNFKFFLEKDIQQEKSLTLDFVVTRICNSLSKSKPQIQIHAACKATYYLMRSFEKFRAMIDSDPYSSFSKDSPEMKQGQAILQKLYKRLDTMLIHDCSFIKFQAFKASIWRLDKVPQVVRRLKMEIKSNVNWMPFHIHELLITLLDFSRNRPNVFDEFANLCSYICIYLSDRVDVDLLIALFKQLIPTKQKDERQVELTTRFLAMVFTILDECLTGSRESTELTFSILTFLGEYANKICDEPSVNEKDSIEIVTSTITDPKDIFNQSDVFDIQNGAMKSIVLKLIQNAMYNTPQIRTCCLEGLAKIAFRSLDPIRLFVYEFLSYMSQHEYFGVSAQCKSITNVLDEIYMLQQTFIKLTATKAPTDDELCSFFDEHERVKEKINFFARSHPSFLPLGLETKAFLKRAFDVKHLRQ
ncbi:hypothetical protein ABK040_014786 [Willaertia magna]